MPKKALKPVSTRDLIRRTAFVIAAVAAITSIILTIAHSNSKDETNDFAPASSTPVKDEIMTQIEALDFKPSQPTTVPKHFKRISIEVISEKASRTGCVEVLQRYGATDTSTDAVEGLYYFDIYSYSTECAFAQPDDAEPLQVGDYEGWVSDTDKSQSVLYELVVNQANLRVETDLNRKEIKPTLEKFEPLTKKAPKESEQNIF